MNDRIQLFVEVLMYNAELKEKFIQETTTSLSMRRAIRIMFNDLESYEIQWGCDVSSQSPDEVNRAIENLCGFRFKNISARVRIIKNYANWCVRRGVDGARSDLADIEVDKTSVVKSKLISCPFELNTYMNTIFRPEKDRSIDDVYRCYLWMVFSGIDTSDICLVSKNNIDIDNMVYKLAGSEYPIYTEAVPSLMNCANLDSLVIFRNGTPYKTQRVKGEEIIRTPSGLASTHACNTQIWKKLAASGHLDWKNKMSYYSLRLSGVFYRTYEKEVAGYPVDFLVDSSGILVKNERRRDSTSGGRPREARSELIRDYEAWKLAFHATT